MVWEEDRHATISNIKLNTIEFKNDDIEKFCLDIFGYKNRSKIGKNDSNSGDNYLVTYILDSVYDKCEELKQYTDEVIRFCDAETVDQDWLDYLYENCA